MRMVYLMIWFNDDDPTNPRIWIDGSLFFGFDSGLLENTTPPLDVPGVMFLIEVFW